MVSVDGIEMDILDGCYHRTNACIGFLAFLEEKYIFARQPVAPVIECPDSGEQDGHMTIMAAALGKALVLGDEGFRMSLSVQVTFSHGQAVDVCPQSNRLAWPVGVKDSIESCAAWHIADLECTDLGQPILQILDGLHLLTTHLGIEMKVAAHLTSILVVVLNLTKYLLVADLLSGKNLHGTAK